MAALVVGCERFGLCCGAVSCVVYCVCVSGLRTRHMAALVLGCVRFGLRLCVLFLVLSLVFVCPD